MAADSNTVNGLVNVLITHLSTLSSTLSQEYQVVSNSVLFKTEDDQILYLTNREEYSTLANVKKGKGKVKIVLFSIAIDILEMKYLSDSMATYLRDNDLLDDYYDYTDYIKQNHNSNDFWRYSNNPNNPNNSYGGYRRTKRTKRTRRHNHKK